MDVGPNVTAPADALVIDASGRWVTPGIIDTHSHLGVYPSPGIEATQDGNEMTSPNTADVSAEHALWPNLPNFETLGATLENAARLAKAGVTVALSTFDTHNARNLRQEAGSAIANGLDRDAALQAVTLVPARLWGIADRYGSIEPGKAADLVVWSGDPLELSPRAEHVFINGREMPQDTRQRQLLRRYLTVK